MSAVSFPVLRDRVDTTSTVPFNVGLSVDTSDLKVRGCLRLIGLLHQRYNRQGTDGIISRTQSREQLFNVLSPCTRSENDCGSLTTSKIGRRGGGEGGESGLVEGGDTSGDTSDVDRML